jgi:tRNA uridine 5-carbamoylmethylation protein Kti12
MTKTKVICLYGGPGSGKSTTAADLFAIMKKNGLNVELVREYVKDWAWENKKINQYDQLYITAKQAKAEYTKYGKVDFIVTDSPVYLGSFYSGIYGGVKVDEAVSDLMVKAQKDGIQFHHFWIIRNKPYNPEGRYQTESEAIELDKKMKDFLAQRYVYPVETYDAEDIWNFLTRVQCVLK